MSGNKREFEGRWPPNGKWKSPSLEGAARAAYLAKENLQKSTGRGRPSVVHPVFDAVRRSLKKRATELGPRGHDRFLPYRVEFAMLYLASFSPSVVQRLLNEIFTAEVIRSGPVIQWGPTPPSITTIRRTYFNVQDELVRTDLVSRIPKQWHLLLRKYKMGAWHKEAPDWMLEAFFRAGTSAPLPLRVIKPRRQKGKRGKQWDKLDADDFAEDFDSVTEVISNQTRQTSAAISAAAKTRRLERELAAIRKVFPNFELEERERLIAWDLGLTAVRVERERRRSIDSNMVTAVQENPKTPKKGAPLRIVPERENRKSGSLSPVEASHQQVVSTNQESQVPSSEASNEFTRIQVSLLGNGGEDDGLPASSLLGESGNEQSWILKEHRIDFLRSDQWEFAYCPMMVFPDVLKDTPEDTYQAWLDHDPDHDESGVPFEPEYDYAFEYQEPESEIVDLVDHGYLAEAMYGDAFPGMHRSLLFCWILEKIVSRTLKLKSAGQIDLGSNKKYVPMAYIWNETDAEFWIEHWNPQFWAPLTPIRLEMLRPRSASEIPDGYEWIPGWGFMPRDAVEHAMLIYNEPQSSTMKDEKLRESEWTWAHAVYRARGATRVAGDISFVHRALLPGGKAMFSMPFCVDFSSIRFPESDWMNFCETPGMWVPRGHGEISVVDKLIQVESDIHLPSVLMIERYLVGRAEAFLEKRQSEII